MVKGHFRRLLVVSRLRLSPLRASPPYAALPWHPPQRIREDWSFIWYPQGWMLNQHVECWNVENFKCWNVEILCSKANVEMLKCWKCWNVEMLNVEMLKCWMLKSGAGETLKMESLASCLALALRAKAQHSARLRTLVLGVGNPEISLLW